MSQQVINIGSAPNDGTGSQIRTAFNDVNLNFTELYIGTAPVILPPTAIAALVIDTSKRFQTKTISTDSTFTFSGAPTAGTQFSVLISNSDPSLPKTATVPSSWSIERDGAVTTVSVPQSSKMLLTWYYDGSTYFLTGGFRGVDSTVGGFTYLAGRISGANATAADFSVFVGYDAGNSQNYGGSNGQAVAVGYAAGVDPGGYAGTFIGYTAGNAGGGTSAVCIGYAAVATADKTGTGNNVIGVHAAETVGTLSAAQVMGYHAADQATSALSSIVIGDHAASGSAWTINNSIFIGPFSGVNRTNTLWIDGTATSIGGTTPLLYGQFDNFKLTINGGTLVTGTTKAAANTVSVASAALEVQTTTQGVLFPRMTTTQKNAIGSPPAGLVVYDTTLGKLCVHGAANWETITSV